MYSMPLIHDHFNPRPASEAMLPVGERLPVMPVIGAQGEMVYYVPGNTPGLPALGGGVPSAGVRLDPNDLICDLQMLQHASPEGLMMPAPTNSLLPLNGSNATMLQSVDLVSNNAGSIVQSSQVQHITNTCLVQHQNNSEVAKNMIQATNQIKDSSKQRMCSLFLNESQGNSLSNPMSAFPSLLEVPCLSKATVSGFEHQSLLSKVQNNSTEFGPVERAIFKQALSVQNKKRNNGSEIESIPTTATQNFSELKSRSSKHFGKMFETHLIRAGNTCNRSTSREREIPNSESRHNLSSKTNASGAPSNSLTTDLIKPLSTSNPCSKPLKPSSLPSIRYHPYVTYERKKKEVCLENKMQESTKSPESKPFTLQCVSPSSSCNTWDVHSVTVPRNGGFTLNRPISNAQTLSNALPVGSDNKNDVATAGKCSHTENTPSIGKSTEFDLSRNGDVKEGEEILNEIKDEKPIPEDPANEETANQESSSSSDPPQKEVNLPNPLPSYITKIDKPPSRVLKESLHCTTCDVYVNSDNQMKQHINSLRHKNTLQGIPNPAKPVRDEKPKLRADQYKCNVCKVTLNSDIQLSQHLSSQRHKNMLEGKPPKPRWSPYERTQATLLHPASAMRLPFTTLTTQPLLTTAQGPSSVVNASVPVPTGISTLGGLSSLPRTGYLPATAALPGATHLKQASLVLNDGGMLQAREIMYVSSPQVNALPAGAQFSAGLPTALVQGQQPLQLQQMVTPQPAAVDWLAAGGMRLTT